MVAVAGGSIHPSLFLSRVVVVECNVDDIVFFCFCFLFFLFREEEEWREERGIKKDKKKLAGERINSLSLSLYSLLSLTLYSREWARESV